MSQGSRPGQKRLRAQNITAADVAKVRDQLTSDAGPTAKHPRSKKGDGARLWKTAHPKTD